MRIFLLYLGVFLCMINYSEAQAPNWQWALSAGVSINDDYGNAVYVDNSANVYSTGSFGSSTLTIGTTNLTRVGLGNVYVVKQDPSGNVTWAKNFGGISAAGGGGIGYAISADPSGNVYVAGLFYSNLVIGTTTLTAVDTTAGNSGDIFLTKLDQSGNVLWAKSAGGNVADLANGIAVDGSGNVFIAGLFRSRNLAIGTTTLSAPNNVSPFAGADIFVAKYSSAGNFVWANNYGTPGNDNISGVSIDAAGNLLIAGLFYGYTNITFGSTTLTSSGASNLYLVKFDNGGSVLWAKTAGQVGTGTIGHSATSISADSNSNVYITGTCNGSAIGLSIGTVTISNTGSFIAKFDSNGSALWGKNIGNGNCYFKGISTDGSGNSYTTGYFDGLTCSFGTSTLTNANTGGNNTDIFVAKFNTSGTLIWAKGNGSIYNEQANGISSNTNGEVAITGKITTTLTLDTYTLNCGGFGSYPDLFISKIGVATAGIMENNQLMDVLTYPNPIQGALFIEANQIKESIRLKIYTILGDCIIDTFISEEKAVIDLTKQSKGLYVLELSSGKNISKRKIIID